MSYRTSFQCPSTGETIIARYAFGRVTFEAVANDDGTIADETREWVRTHTNRRCTSLEAAEEYLADASEGQAPFGFY